MNRDTVRAPYDTTSGRDCVKSLRLCLHETFPQLFSVDASPGPKAGLPVQGPLQITAVNFERKVAPQCFVLHKNVGPLSKSSMFGVFLLESRVRQLYS